MRTDVKPIETVVVPDREVAHEAIDLRAATDDDRVVCVSDAIRRCQAYANRFAVDWAPPPEC